MNKNRFKLILIILAVILQSLSYSYAQDKPTTPTQTPAQANTATQKAAEIPVQPSILQLNLPITQPITTSSNEVIFGQKAYPISAIDPTIFTNTSASFYPGLRGGNQLIIYSPIYGLRTNTNEFGTEAIVNGNIVTSMSGADSIIPKNGVVISGHGTAKKWISGNIIQGAKVYIDVPNKNLNVYVTSDSFLFGAQEKIKECESLVGYYKNLSYTYDYKKPCEYIEKAKDYLNKAQRDPQNVQKYSSLAIEAANEALAHAIPYKQDELKGVWIRPSETTPEEIIQTLNRIKSKGIDNVFLETYFHGKTIFPSKTMENYQFAVQNEKFAGFDPLKIWVEEAHKRNMKVHIWFETFYVGNQNPAKDSKSIIGVNPNWANTTKRAYNTQSPTPSISEHGGYFIDPANPDVQDFLQDLICEIIQTYHPDGINLDYIRYPQSIAAKFPGYEMSNWGYTEYARDEFKKTYGVDPVELSYNDPLWAQWDKYRQDKVTFFVTRIANITKQNNIKLTAVIFPDRIKALETKQQDWRTWSALNCVDGFTPLLLTCDAKTASAMMQDVIRNKSPKTDLYAGLFITFMGGSNDDLLRQIHEGRKLNSNGVIMFDYAHLSDKYTDTLLASVFNRPGYEQIQVQNQNQINIVPKQKKKGFFHRKG